jgi:hypothetical protein
MGNVIGRMAAPTSKLVPSAGYEVDFEAMSLMSLYPILANILGIKARSADWRFCYYRASDCPRQTP